MKTSFTQNLSEWNVYEADLRSQLWIDTGNTYYSVYIDFDNLVMVSQFWRNDQMLTRTEWAFHNSQWDWTNRNSDEQLEHDETVRDGWTDV